MRGDDRIAGKVTTRVPVERGSFEVILPIFHERNRPSSSSSRRYFSRDVFSGEAHSVPRRRATKDRERRASDLRDTLSAERQTNELANCTRARLVANVSGGRSGDNCVYTETVFTIIPGRFDDAGTLTLSCRIHFRCRRV